MNRKMRAARNNQAAKAKKRAREKVMDQPRCNHCGEHESEHIALDIPLELAHELKGHPDICEVILPEKEKLH